MAGHQRTIGEMFESVRHEVKWEVRQVSQVTSCCMALLCCIGAWHTHICRFLNLLQEIESHCAACFAAMEEANATNPALDARIRQFLSDAQNQYANGTRGTLGAGG